MQIHPLANILPKMSAEEFNALQADIKARGLIEPIWTYQSKIIDGRNRYQACLNVGVEPRFREWDGEGSLAAFIYSQNYLRRHLDSSQKAAVSLGFEEAFAEEAKQRQLSTLKQNRDKDLPSDSKTPLGKDLPNGSKESGKAAEQLAKSAGTNRKYIYDAKKIKNSAPDLINEVRDGNLTIPEAKKVAELPLEERTEAVTLIKSAPTAEIKKQVAREYTKPVTVPSLTPIYEKWYGSVCKILVEIESMGRHNPKDVAIEIERWSDEERRVYADRLIKAAKSLAQMYTQLTEEEVDLDEAQTAEPIYYSN